MIPQKAKLPMNYFETFPECSLPSTVLKSTIKMIDHRARLRDVTGKFYPIYACTRANHALKGRRTLAEFLSADKKNFACRLVCGEFRKVCKKIGACRAISDSTRSRNVLSASVRWTKTIRQGSCVSQPMRYCHASHVNKPFFKHGGDPLGPKTKRG